MLNSYKNLIFCINVKIKTKGKRVLKETTREVSKNMSVVQTVIEEVSLKSVFLTSTIRNMVKVITMKVYGINGLLVPVKLFNFNI